jgi:hypothetical protein
MNFAHYDKTMKALQMARHYMLLATILSIAVPFPGAAQELDLAFKPLFQIEGDASGDSLGTGLHNAGDIDGDGFDDLFATAIADPGSQQTLRYARIYSGRDGEVLVNIPYTPRNPENGTLIGSFRDHSFAALGDIDGDTIPDFIVRDSKDGNELAVVYSGKSGAVIRTHSEPDHEQTGSLDLDSPYVKSTGDLNADGAEDYAVSFRRYEVQPLGYTAVVYSGATGEVLFTFRGLTWDQFLIGGVSDLSPELVIVSGAVRGEISADTIPPDMKLGAYRHPLGIDSYSFVMGDVDGDHYVDVLIYGDEGKHHAISCRPESLGGLTLLWKRTGRFFANVGVIGDVDGDGADDQVVRHGPLILDGDDGDDRLCLISSADREFHCKDANDWKAASGLVTARPLLPDERSFISDLDGDGWNEFAVGDKEWNNSQGRIVIYSMGPGSHQSVADLGGKSPLEFRVDRSHLTVTWPFSLNNVALEYSEDLVHWEAPPLGYDATRRRYVMPHAAQAPAAYFRLREIE